MKNQNDIRKEQVDKLDKDTRQGAKPKPSSYKDDDEDDDDFDKEFENIVKQ